MKNNNTEKLPYQQLLGKLDDEEFAREFFDEKQVEAKDLIYQILSVTLGHDVITESGNEWGHRNLFKVLDMLMIRHKNFDRSQLAENLQTALFHYTMKHDESYREWSKDWQIEDALSDSPKEQIQDAETPAQNHELTSIGIDGLRFALAAISVNPNTPPKIAYDLRAGLMSWLNKQKPESVAENATDERERHYNQIWANKLSYILASDDVSAETKNVVEGLLSVIANESNTGFYDEPEVLKVGFPLQMEKLSSAERRAFILSIDSVLESCLGRPFLNKLDKFNVRFEDRAQTEDPPRDYSTPEKNQDGNNLAELLSKVINHPDLPARLHMIIADELSEVPSDW